MDNFLHDSMLGVAHNAVSAVEQALKVKFPDDMVQFWEKHQGGWPEKDTFGYTDMYGNSNDGQVTSFLLLNHQDEEMVCKTLLYRKEGRVLECHVVIADEAGGHKILYNNNDGKIYVWDHENEDVAPKNCYPIGENFTHFFNDVLYEFELSEDDLDE